MRINAFWSGNDSVVLVAARDEEGARNMLEACGYPGAARMRLELWAGPDQVVLVTSCGCCAPYVETKP